MFGNSGDSGLYSCFDDEIENTQVGMNTIVASILPPKVPCKHPVLKPSSYLQKYPPKEDVVVNIILEDIFKDL